MDLDDSLSKLLPGEKHDKRQRKDIGTTTYKKPGPPTPSKNGGRLSLQGNEVHPLRESNDKTPLKKVTTPGRLKSLFSSKNVTSSLRENSEVQELTHNPHCCFNQALLASSARNCCLHGVPPEHSEHRSCSCVNICVSNNFQACYPFCWLRFIFCRKLMVFARETFLIVISFVTAGLFFRRNYG